MRHQTPGPLGRRPDSQVVRRRGHAAFEPLERRRLLTAVVVNTVVDTIYPASTGLVSLRSAIATANASTTATTITFDPKVFATAQTIVESGTPLALTNTKEATTITGTAAGVTVSGNKQSIAFTVASGASATISNLSIVNGYVGAGNTTYDGGAIDNSGMLRLTGVTMSGNAGSGAGAIVNRGTVTLIDDTVSGNSTTGQLNGGPDAGGILNFGTMTIEDTTVANNLSAAIYYGHGPGGVENYAGHSLTVVNSIIAGNTTKNSSDGDVNGAFVSYGFNLIGETDTGTGFNAADLTGTIAKPLNAGLGALASNGGPTQTMLPLTSSPAINKGSNAFIPAGTTTDQRGLARISNGTVDIGAVEVQAAAVTLAATAAAAQSATAGTAHTFSLGSFTETGATGPYTVTVSWGDGTTATTFTTTATGALAAQSHTYAKAGANTVTVSVKDSAGHASNAATFTATVTAPGGSISGTVFDDVNGNGKRDAHELGLGLWTVYLDKNDDGKLDAGDVSATTDVNGSFTFANLAAGTYYLRVVPVSGTTATTPAGGLVKVTLAAGQLSTGNLFGAF
jgi:hypothetical protein